MKYNKFFMLMLCIIFIGSISSLISPILIQIWSQDLVGLSRERLLMLFLILIATTLIEIIAVIFRERFAKNFNIQNVRKLLGDYLNASYDFIQENGSMYLIDRISITVNQLYAFFIGDNINIWTSSLVMLGGITIIGFYHSFLALVLIGLIPINYFGYKAINKELVKHSTELQQVTAVGWQQILSVLKHPDYIKQSNQHDRLFQQIDPAIEQIYGVMAKTNIFAQSSSHLLKSVNSVANVMIMAN